jgi:nucleoside-diphosphate-sugar epimerase
MILVTGGAGVLGSRLVKGLVSRGHKVRVLVLPDDPSAERLSDVACEIVYGDVAAAASLAGIFDGVKTVYHLAAIIISYESDTLWRINVGGTRNMVSGALGAGVEHFIYISSVSASFPQGSDYAQSKLQAEQIVKSQNKMHYTIVRPTLIYGKGQGQEFMMFMDSLTKYTIVPFVGQGEAKKNPVLADDIVAGLLPIAGNHKTYNKTYNFSGGEEINLYDLARLMLKSQGMSRPFLCIPLPICRLIAFIMEMTMKRPPLTRYAISRIEHDAVFDNTEAREDLGYNPVGVTEGLQLCYGPFKK